MNEALRLLLHLFAGWVNRQQLDVVDYLCEENRVLREQLGGRRLRLTDAQRGRLAVKGKAIGRKVLKEVEVQEALTNSSVILERLFQG